MWCCCNSRPNLFGTSHSKLGTAGQIYDSSPPERYLCSSRDADEPPHTPSHRVYLRGDCFVPGWVILEESGPKGRLVEAGFSCSIRWDRRPRAEAARTLMDGLAFSRPPVPGGSRCYENIAGSRLTERRETDVMDDHLLDLRCRCR